MLDTTTHDAATAFVATQDAALRALPASRMQELALEAFDLFAQALDHDTETTEDQDEARDAAFWGLIDQAAAPARTADEVTAKAAVVALLAHRELHEHAAQLAHGLAADLARLS